MKLTKKVQYGILLALYITRSGRVTIEGAAEGLGLPAPFLFQIARRLNKHGVIKSFRGPKGGYELIGDPSVNDVFNALSSVALLTKNEMLSYKVGHPEHRAFAQYVTSLGMGLYPLLTRKVRSVMQELVVNEIAHLDRIAADSAIN